MKNKYLITLLCIFSLAFPAYGATVTIGTYTAGPGGSVVAPLTADVGAVTLGSTTIKITYDPALVHVTSVVAGTGNALGTVVSNIDNSSGIVQISGVEVNGKTGIVIIANIALTAVGSPGTSSPLNIGIITFDDLTFLPIPATPINGKFDIIGSGAPAAGNGGGGGGGTSGEDFSNIIVKEKYDMFIFKDKVTSYAFSNGSNPIQYINITGNVSAGEINTAVEVLRTKSSLVKNIAPGVVYRNINIWVGTTGFAVPVNIREGVIVFFVENSWFDDNNLARGDVRMVRWDGNQWVQLETVEKMRNDSYTWFEAKSKYFSPFAITGLKSAVTVTTTTPDEEVTQAMPTVTDTAAQRTTGFEFILTVAILSIVYMFERKR